MHNNANTQMIFNEEKMLVWGKTIPELSRRYTETVCTGGVLLDRPGLLRIYPLDFRYLPEAQRPEKWSIMSAKIARNFSDPRPESYRIEPRTIQIERKVGTSEGWRERKDLMLRPEHMVEGLEDMATRQRENGQSLGIVKPHEIIDVTLEKTTSEERREWDQKCKEILSQRDLWPAGERPVPMPDYKPRMKFKCPGDSKPYDRVVKDWEFYESVKRHLGEQNPVKAFRDFVFDRYFSDQNEPYLIFGNISTHPHTFVLVCMMYPRKFAQQSLF